ncbi:MAG: hypothetical protein M3459_10240, partial [Actinomycetota bacterium]|nr:hypothetical protein [Actinomycetota bacterium]
MAERAPDRHKARNRGADKEPDRPAPWRVEGDRGETTRGDGDEQSGRRFRPPGGRIFWILLGVLLVIN